MGFGHDVLESHLTMEASSIMEDLERLTPTWVHNDERNFNKNGELLKKGQQFAQPIWDRDCCTLQVRAIKNHIKEGEQHEK